MPAEQGPVDRDRDAARFAAALDQGLHPGSVADPGLARDLEIVARLRSRGEAFAPDADERARAKQRLTALLARPDATATSVMPVVPPADAASTDAMPAAALSDTALSDTVLSDTDPPVTDVTPGRRSGRRSGRHVMPSRPAGRARSASRGLRRRAVVVGAAALAALVALAGGGIFASRDTLPGDGLYAVKRVAESAGLAMTFDDTAKARRELELAGTRLDEVERLTTRAPAGDAADPALIRSTIRDFDSSTGAGSRTLLNADDAGGAATLEELRSWAGDQSTKFSTLRPSLPAAAVPGADDTIGMLDRLLGRTKALSARSTCEQVTSGAVDDLGPLPSEGTCSPRPSAAGSTSAGSRSDGGAPGTGGAPEPSSSSPDGSTATTDREGPTQATGGAETDDPATTNPGSTDSDSPGGLLPDLLGPQSTGDEGSRDTAPSTTTTRTSERDDISVPLPLLPPITVPPLLPGAPGITIG